MSSSIDVLENLCAKLSSEITALRGEVTGIKGLDAAAKSINATVALIQSSADAMQKQHGAVLSALAGFAPRIESMERSQLEMIRTNNQMATGMSTQMSQLTGQMDQLNAVCLDIRQRLGQPIPIDLQPLEATISRRVGEETRAVMLRSGQEIAAEVSKQVSVAIDAKLGEVKEAAKQPAGAALVPWGVAALIGGFIWAVYMVVKATNSAPVPVFDLKMPEGFKLHSTQMPGGSVPKFQHLNGSVAKAMSTLPAAPLKMAA